MHSLLTARRKCQVHINGVVAFAFSPEQSERWPAPYWTGRIRLWEVAVAKKGVGSPATGLGDVPCVFNVGHASRFER